MPIPTFYSFVLPVLRLSDKGEIKLARAVDSIADHFELTAPERRELVPSGRLTRVKDRTNWAVTYLAKAGLVTRPRHGYFVITSSGKKVLSNPPEEISGDFLMQFDGFRKFKTEKKARRSRPTVRTRPVAPDKRVEDAVEDMEETLREDLLSLILASGPASFERLISDLMEGLSYRTDEEDIESTDDGVIQGVVHQDKLGLDAIHLRAERHPVDHSVGVESVRQFVAALDEYSTTKGVFITTGQFHPDAVDYARNSRKSLILMDGQDLTRRLLECGIAVYDYQTINLMEVDTDYFEDDDD